MPDVTTITNVPEAADPSALADWAGLITSVTGLMVAIGWPIVVIVGMILFRKSIRSFVGRIKNAKGLGLDLETQLEVIATQVEAVEIQAELADPVETTPLEAAPDTRPSEPTPIDYGVPPFGDQKRWNKSNNSFQQTVRHNPSSALLLTWAELEVTLQNLARSYGVAVTVPRLMLNQLSEMGVTSSLLTGVILDLERLRTSVAHGFMEPTSTDAWAFRTSAKSVQKELHDIFLRAQPDRPQPPSA